MPDLIIYANFGVEKISRFEIYGGGVKFCTQGRKYNYVLLVCNSVVHTQMTHEIS